METFLPLCYFFVVVVVAFITGHGKGMTINLNNVLEKNLIFDIKFRTKIID